MELDNGLGSGNGVLCLGWNFYSGKTLPGGRVGFVAGRRSFISEAGFWYVHGMGPLDNGLDLGFGSFFGVLASGGHDDGHAAGFRLEYAMPDFLRHTYLIFKCVDRS